LENFEILAFGGGIGKSPQFKFISEKAIPATKEIGRNTACFGKPIYEYLPCPTSFGGK
jgi:hypothetical protein